jgi:hypothetical protein
VASLFAAHQPGGPGLDSARAALAAQRGESVLVVREGWRAAVHAIDAPTSAWTRALLARVPLDQALVRAGSGFDFSAWLARALAQEWLVGAEWLQGPPRTGSTARAA